MDATTMSQIGLGGGTIGILMLAWKIFTWLNHRNIRSKCCGKTFEVELDVETPKKEPPASINATEPEHSTLQIRAPEGLEDIHRRDRSVSETSGAREGSSAVDGDSKGRDC
jgi:hypothetical protein